MSGTFWGIGIGNHGRPWACEREGPVLKKMLWEVGVYSRLLERLIKDGRDSADRRVVSDTDTPKSSPKKYAEIKCLQTFAAVFAVVGVEVGLLVAAGASAVFAFLLGGVNHCGRYDTGGHSYDGVTQDHYYS